MKKVIGIIISLTLLTAVFMPATAKAATGNISEDISINAEYLIKDTDGLHTRYVVLATNSGNSDISVSADFYAVSADGSNLKTVHDYAEAVKKGQTFIVYGQFRNDVAARASGFSYSIKATETVDCRYDAIGIDSQKSEDNSIIITGTNYSKSNVNAVNVRSIFYKDGAPVAFDSVNIGDSGYSLRSGGTGVQELGLTYSDYDDYVITYSVASTDSFTKDF